jgi:hypothetical protein
MRIFNVILNGDDAKYFCSQSTEFKIAWIRNNTNQQNIKLIMDFIKHPPKDAENDCGCGSKKKLALSDLKSIEKPIENIEEKERQIYPNVKPIQEDSKKSFPKKKRLKK